MVREFKDKGQNVFLNIQKKTALAIYTWHITSLIYGTDPLANISTYRLI